MILIGWELVEGVGIYLLTNLDLEFVFGSRGNGIWILLSGLGFCNFGNGI